MSLIDSNDVLDVGRASRLIGVHERDKRVTFLELQSVVVALLITDRGGNLATRDASSRRSGDMPWIDLDEIG